MVHNNTANVILFLKFAIAKEIFKRDFTSFVLVYVCVCWGRLVEGKIKTSNIITQIKTRTRWTFTRVKNDTHTSIGIIHVFFEKLAFFFATPRLDFLFFLVWFSVFWWHILKRHCPDDLKTGCIRSSIVNLCYLLGLTPNTPLITYCLLI